MAEKNIEEATVKWAKRRGWIVVKFTPFGDTGWPDRIFISQHGVHVWIEFKDEGKKPRKLQDYRLNQLVAQNAYAYWVDSQDKAKELLTKHE